MNAQDLKSSILQRAIEGKLVPQRQEEGTAKELLAEIRAEKARLIKEKKIKKSKPLPEITDAEKPFDIPESWEWVRIGELFSLQAGKNIKATYIYHEQTESHVYPCYGGNGVRGFVEFFNSEGDFPIIGRQGALCGNINRAKGKFYATEHAVLTTTFANTDVSWACYFLKALNLNQYATATAQPGLAVSKINQVLIPLPPLAEQHRIVAKIEELQPDIDAYDKAKTKLQAIEKRFPNDMKKSLLQYAIEGKLVPQRKEEGTAKDLLATIRAEKAQLIKEKKIKKTKPLPAITDDEKPYAIPDSWEWRRLGDISTIVTGGTPSKSQPLYYGGNVPFYKPADIQDNKYVNTPKEFLSIMGKEKAKFVPKGSVAVNCIGNIGKSAILPRDGATNQQINSICYYIYPDYLYWFCQSMMFILQLKKVSSMTTIPIVNKSKVEQCIIPLPPLAEQHRIVAKLEELLPLCQHLTANP